MPVAEAFDCVVSCDRCNWHHMAHVKKKQWDGADIYIWFSEMGKKHRDESRECSNTTDDLRVKINEHANAC